MVANTKQCQTLINAAAEEVQRIQESATRLEGLRALYQTAGVDPTGTPLAGNVAAVSAWIDSIRAVADSPVATGLISAYVPTHRGEAL